MLAVPLTPLRLRGQFVNWLRLHNLPALGRCWASVPTRGARLPSRSRNAPASRGSSQCSGGSFFNGTEPLVLALALRWKRGPGCRRTRLHGHTHRLKVASRCEPSQRRSTGRRRRSAMVRARRPADTVFSFTMPFMPRFPPSLGGSGLVAAVVAGLVVSRRRAAVISASNRRFSQQNWQTATLVLEAEFLFLTMGLQAFGIVERPPFLKWPDLSQLSRRHPRRAHHGDSRRLHHFSCSPGWITAAPRRATRVETRIAPAQTRPARSTRTCSARNRPRHWAGRAQSLPSSPPSVAKRRNFPPYAVPTWIILRTSRWVAHEGSVIVWAGVRGAATLAAARTVSTLRARLTLLSRSALFIAAGALVIQA